jgi:hypothetical protein
MAHTSGNPTWQDYPSTSTLITATSLEGIEGAIDTNTAALSPLQGGGHVRYHCTVSGGQNIFADGTPKTIPFDTAVDTHTDVTRNGTTTFTLNRAGVWIISIGLRNQTTVAAVHQFMIWDGTTSTNRYAEQVTASGTATSWSLTTQRRFTAGSVVAAGLAILTTATNDKVATDVPGSTFFAATWIRP